MNQVAWYPRGMVASPELTAVWVQPGLVTERVWIEALSDRIKSLVMSESDPRKAADQACLQLDLANAMNPNQLGQVLVSSNLELRTFLTATENEFPFNVQVSKSDPRAESALKETNLQEWVNLAASVVNVSSLE